MRECEAAGGREIKREKERVHVTETDTERERDSQRNMLNR